MSEVPDASKDTRVDSPFQGSVPFCGTSLFKEDFSFSRKDRVSFFMLVVYAKDSMDYLETSLFPFLALRRGMIRMYIRARDIL